MTQRRRPNHNPRSPLFELAETDFRDLLPIVKKRIIRLLAQVSEKSYRRGVHHGVECRDVITRDVPTWRSGPLNRSPQIDSPLSLPSVEMLFREYGTELHNLGFDDPRVKRSRPRRRPA